MSSFDEYRKKLQNKYGLKGNTKSEEEKTTQNGGSSAGTTNKPASSGANKTTVKTSGNSPFDSYREKLRSKYLTDKIDADGVIKWFDDAYSAMEKMESYNKANADKYDADYGGDAGKHLKNVLDSSKDVYNYIYNHEDEFDNVDELKEMFNQYQSDLLKFDKANYDTSRYYSSFGSEGEYNNYLASVDYGNKSAEELEAYKGTIGSDVQQHEYAGFYVNLLKEGKTDEWIRKNMPDYAQAYDYIVDKYDIDTEVNTPAYIGEIIYEKTMSLPITEKNPVLYYDQHGAVTLDNLITVKKTEGKIAAIQSDNALKTSYDELMSYNQDIKEMEAAMAALSAKDEGAAVYPEDMEAYNYIINKYGIDTEGHTNASINQLIYETYLQLIDGSYSGQQKHKGILSRKGYDWDELLYYHDWNEDRNRQLELKKSYEMAAEDYPALTTVANLFTGPAQAVEFAGDVLERATYAGKDKHSAYGLDNIYDNNANAFSETVSGTATGNIKNEVMDKTGSEFWSNLAGTAYGGVTSAVQSYVTQAMLGPVGGSLILASQAASSKYIEGIKNGQTTEQAMAVGVISGVAEYFTEKITWEKLIEIDTSWDTATVGAFLKSLFKNSTNVFLQGLYEGGEEVISAISSTIADEVIGQDKSSIASAIKQYKMAGLSDTDAKKQATQDWWAELLDSAIGGFIGGAGAGGVVTAAQTGMMGATGIANNSRENKAYKTRYDGEILSALVDEALEIDPNNKLAKQIKEKISSGKNVSGAQIKSLVQSNEAGIVEGDIAAIKSAAGTRLTDLGETADIDVISSALAKQAAGEELSETEQQAIRNSKYGEQVAEELNPDTVYFTDSAWTGKIDTARINPDVYSRLVDEAQITQEGTKTPESTTPTLTKNAPQKAEIEPVEDAAEASDVEEDVITIEEASKKYGAQAQAMIHTYHEGQDVAKYDAAYEQAYNMGNSGVSLSYAMNSESTAYLTETQRELAYKAGMAASDTAATEKEAANKKLVNGKTGRKKGVVRGEGVTISDLKKTFNDRQNTAYKLLSTYAEATGVDIVLYRSEANAEGRYEGAQGKYKHSEPGTIYIDINAGLSKIKDVNDLAKYTMLRTFAHEFTHFIENWNPVQYNVFRKVVFDTLTERGENVQDLIEEKQAANPGMSYDKASREVVAEAMTDILPNANFVEKLAINHKTIFDKLLEKLKEFVNILREYFNSIGHNRSREANALKEQVGDAVHYVESIVNLFDNVAVQAVENYQATVAEDVVAETVDEKVSETKSKTKVAEPKTKTEPKTTTSEHGFTITDNVERGSLEITFNEKPSDAVRDVLKENKFRWHGKNKVWYGYAEREAITEALNKAYEAEVKPVESAPKSFAEVMENATQEERDEVVEAINANTKLTHIAPTEIREQVVTEEAITPTENIEEATTNGTENVDNGQTVLGSDADGQGTSRLLDGSQVEDVQETSSGGDTVTDSSERGTETSRDDDRPDTTDRSGRSEGVSEVGDLRRNDELTPEQETEIKAEQLHEEVEKQIEQKSTEKPKGNNFVIGDSLNLPTGEKARFRANVDAIRLIKQLATEDRYATAAEQEILSKYVGWGGLANAFGEMKYNRDTRRSEMTAKDGWASEFEELRSLVDEGVITEQEYKDMSASTKNAHYTSVEVIKAMYDGLKQLGFKGGRMLEPSSGVGNFVGAMPADMSAKVNSWTMVELDRITGQIAKYLYPNSDVRIQGFETANIPDNYMDVAIGNVPFGNFGVVDRTYPKRVTKSIHNYFFAKSIDKVRPGGIVMFITSSFTMDSKDAAIRQYMMERADLLGAIRLPNTSFKDNAGTEVVTDILILKKREGGTEYSGADFLNADYDYNHGSYVSNYFKEHPEMVLGTPVTKSGMYGSRTLTYEPLKDRGTIDDQIREAFKNIKGEMTYIAKLSPEKTNFAVERATKKTKAGGFVVNKDGSISRSENGQLVKYDTDEKTAKRIAGMLGIRDAYRTLANNLQQGVDAKIVKQSRKALNTAYDSFVKEYGYINSPANRKAIDSDPDSYSILSLENYDVKKKTATKADIFTKDTISANKTVTHVDSVSEGVIASLNLTGGVDTELIAKLTSRTVEDVTNEVIASRLAFKTRNGTLVARESYLAGNVRAKLREAESLVPYDKDYAHNIEELRRVIPKDIPYNEIYITPGATFIPNEVYADFIAHMLGGRNNPNSYSGPDVEVGRTVSGEFKITLNNKRLKASYYNTQTWGTARKSFLELIDAMMGSRTVKVNDTVEGPDGKKISVLNEAETEAANEKVKAIQKEFEDWLWKDETRRTELAKLYNETFNAIVNPKYDGSNLTVNGINADFKLREHQANAVHRIISSGGNTLLAHRVGAGKTLEMAAAAMKLRELGVVKKPVFVVPKALVAQWGVEFHSYFPASRILVADDKSFTPANRKVFTNKIANGDYDAVIVSYEQFEKIPMSAEYQTKFYEEQIDEIINAIAEEKAESRDGKGLTVKEMEKKKAQLEKKLKELTSKPKDEDNIDFEMLGIDSLFVDEAHNFKNLEYVSKMTNVAGLGSAKGSQRAFDLYTKVRYLQGMNGGRGIVFATATPVMNSMVELYIMQRYLQPDVLEQLGLKSFDAWAKQFGEVVNKWEINPSGTGMRQKQVFANFRNLNELQLLFRSFSDVLTDVPGLKIPKMKGGAVKIVECEPGQFQKDYMLQLQKRAEVVKSVDPSIDNMLKITSDGRKVSYTQRMIDPSLPYEAGSKIYRCCENVLAEYKDSSSIKGTQIIFCDMATPKGSDKNKVDNTADNVDDAFDEGSAKLYDDMRAYLVKAGIPAKEIAFIHEADSDAKRKQLFADVNDGKVRVLIGSTGKMGVGMNAQKRIVAIHHLDAPWRPGDVEQRDGRAFRQKNINEEVSKYVYVTKGSFDSRLWDILDRKQHFIGQIMNGEDVGRTAEDTGEVTLSAAEVKALASGNPLIEEQTKLTDAIKKLENLQKAYNSSIRLAKTKLSDDEQKIAYYTTRIANIREDIKSRVDTYSEGKFSMNVGGQVYTDKKDAGAALAAEIAAKAVQGTYVTVGTFAGFELKVLRETAEYKGLIQGNATYKFNVYLTNTTRMVNHIGEIIAGFENMITYAEQSLSDVNADLKAQQEIISKPFEKAEELAEKRARFNEVMELLAPKTEQQHGSDSEDVQYQARAYLGEERYSYEWFVNKPDMAVTSVDDSVKYKRADIVSFALKNAASVGYTNENGNAVVHVNDIDTDVIVPKRSLVHGLDRRINTQAPVLVEIGNVLKNAIRVNELIPRAVEIKNAYVLIGAAQNQNGNLYIASFVVNKYSNEVSEIDVLYSANAKKESAALLPKITDKSATPTDSTISIAELLEYVNRYFPDVLPESVLKHFGHDARPEGTIGEDALYQQRTSTLTNREILAMAAGDINIGELTPGEQDALNIFQKHLARLEELQEKRIEQGRLYKEQQFGEKVDREAAAETLNRMHILDDQIKAENDDLFTIEEKAVLRKVLEKARKVIEQAEREHGKEILKRWRDRRNNAADIKKYRERIRADVDELSNWVLHPNNKDVVKHIPDALKGSVIPFLSSINFMSKQSLKGGNPTVADKEFIKRMNDLKATLKPHANVGDMYNGYTDLPENFMDRLDTFITAAQALVENNNGEFIINQMTAAELKELSLVVRNLKAYIQNFNKFHVNAMFQHVYEAGDDTILSLGAMKSAGPHTGNISNFVLWQQMRPAYAFERFGDGGKAIYDGLRRGQATLAFNTKKIQEFAEKAYTAAEVKAWEKEIKEIRVGGDIIKMPVSTIMSFYELSKRSQALGHILGEGIRVATFKANDKKISDVGHTLTQNDVKRIIATLTPRQKEVADTLQKFMQEQGGKWGNYVSVKRFGEELFGEENYFPINSDGRHLSVNAEEHPAAASLYALLNMGFTKSTQEGAKNRIVLYSIFDVFANHMASMAQYNAFALPVVDAIKWFNYQQKSEPDENGARAVLGSVRDQMDRVYGVPEETRPGSGRQGYAQTFVINILKAFNGTEAQGVPTDTTGLNALRQYNMAQVAYNLRVVMQQPMAITRAAQVIDYSSILKGMKLDPKAIQRNIEEMQKYSGIAAWKSLGFYDINISRGLTEIIKHRSTVLDKVNDVGMWGAEKADLMTWAAMWSAAKQEVIKKQKLTPKSEGFYEAVTELFEEVIYKTQVVDSVLTKNEYLRSKGVVARYLGSFMSEPTTTASMLVDAYDKYHADIQRGFTKQEAWKRNKDKIIRTAYVYAISAVMLAAVQAVADAWRDDDDYENFLEKWLEAFKGNVIDELVPINKLPILSDVYELLKELLSVFGVDTYGNAPQSVIMQWWDVLVDGIKILHDRRSGADTNYTWYGGVYKLLQAIAGMTGLPMATTTREFVTAWNSTVGSMAPSLKVKSYEPSEQAQIKYAYQDGYLTAEEATKELIEKGIVDTENEAYFIIAEWEDPDGSYSRYDKLYDAVRNGGDFGAAMDELVSHGYTEKDVLSQLKGEIGTWYKEGKITKQQATSMLTKHFNMDSEEITAAVNKWSSKVVTGIEFDDIKTKYLDGEITASRAVEMYVRYGGYTKAQAQQKVSEWDFEEKHGYTYGNRSEQFKEGNISAAELINIMVSFDGKTMEEAQSSLASYTKSGYEEGYFARSKAIDIMIEHGGLTMDEAETKVQHIDFKREYPGYELTEVQVSTYYNELAYTGLGVPEYAQYVEERKGIKGVDADGDGKTDAGSVKSQVMIVIDSLPITTEQKDALYYLNGWAASRIYEAPWH